MMRTRYPLRTLRAQSGVALLESMIAVVILAIGLIGTLVLQTRSQAALSEAGMRVEATIAAGELLGVMNSDLGNLDGYALAAGATPGPRLSEWRAALASRLPNSVVTVAIEPAANTERTAVTIEITWRRSEGATQNRHRIRSYVARSA